MLSLAMISSMDAPFSSPLPRRSCCRIHRAFNQRVVPEKWGFPPRRNGDQHCVYIRGGEGHYLLEREGRWEKVSFSPGMIIYVPAGVLHGGFTDNPANRPRIMPLRFGFYPDDLGDVPDVPPGEESPEQLQGYPVSPLVFPTKLSPWWRETFELICHLHLRETYKAGAAERAGSLLAALIGQLFWQSAYPAGYGEENSLHRIRQLMDEVAEDNRPLSWFSHRAGLSEKHFQRRFRELFDQPPMDYYRQRRMERALILLQDTRLTIDDLGRRMGYADGFGFSRAFKAHFGFSPGKVRK